MTCQKNASITAGWDKQRDKRRYLTSETEGPQGWTGYPHHKARQAIDVGRPATAGSATTACIPDPWRGVINPGTFMGVFMQILSSGALEKSQATVMLLAVCFHPQVGEEKKGGKHRRENIP